MLAAVANTPILPGLSPVAGKSIKARFDGGLLSSDGGLLGLRAIEQRLGIASRLAACIDDPRAPGRVLHGRMVIVARHVLPRGGRSIALQR